MEDSPAETFTQGAVKTDPDPESTESYMHSILILHTSADTDDL